MANEDIGKIYKELTDLAIDTNELQNDKTIPNIIKKLDDLRKVAVSYDGEIARILPVQLKFQIDNLKALQAQTEKVSKAVATNLNSLAQTLTVMPWGQLVGTESLNIPNLNVSNTPSGSSLPQTPDNTDENGVAPQAPVNITGSGDVPPSDQPKSAILQNESTLWNSLKGRFAGSNMPGGDAAGNGGFFSTMRESFSRMDFGLDSLNEVQDDNKKSFWESLTSSLPRSSASIDVSAMAGGQEMSFGGHYVEDNEIHFEENGSEHMVESMNMSGDKFDNLSAFSESSEDLNPDFGDYIADEGDSFSVVGEDD